PPPGEQEWISLSEAAELLGVHPNTLRHWADQGEFPSVRTPGGHRRFRRADVEAYLNRSQRTSHPPAIHILVQSALGQTRLGIGEGDLYQEDWYVRLDEAGQKAYGGLGREILKAVSVYLGQPQKRAEGIAKFQDLGRRHARVARRYNLTIRQTVAAYLYFRDFLLNSTLQIIEAMTSESVAHWHETLRQINLFLDEMLLALVESFEEQERKDRASREGVR
ncbi:MAG TPA: helix-turn-helix domain-containing protein, partial [Chloroflexi bacterium]|nr:helix-turn-helix domain-containing protein [Chloroflexota bacterium]